MTSHNFMLGQSLELFAQNIALLIGILVTLLFGGIILVAFSVTLRIWLFHRRQRLARAEYLRRTRRSDGKMYPPHGIGICEHCSKVRKFVYYLPTGEQLCPTCYEAYWSAAEEKARREAAERGPVADPVQELPQGQPSARWF